VILLDLNSRLSFFIHSILNLVDLSIVRISFKEYLKNNGEDVEKMKNLGCRNLQNFIKSDRYFAISQVKELFS
jgi:hypothetical protein